MIISKVFTLTSDWLGAVLWYIVVTLTFTATNTARDWDRSDLRLCLIISFVLFVPMLEKKH